MKEVFGVAFLNNGYKQRTRSIDSSFEEFLGAAEENGLTSLNAKELTGFLPIDDGVGSKELHDSVKKLYEVVSCELNKGGYIYRGNSFVPALTQRQNETAQNAVKCAFMGEYDHAVSEFCDCINDFTQCITEDNPYGRFKASEPERHVLTRSEAILVANTAYTIMSVIEAAMFR